MHMLMVGSCFISKWLPRSVLGLLVSAWSFAGCLLWTRHNALLEGLNGLQRQQRGELEKLA